MNNMYFCNLMGNDGVKTFRIRNESTEEFVNTIAEGTVKGFITEKDGQLVVTTNENDVNIFRKGLEGNPEDLYAPELKRNLTFKQIDDTEENPLVIVLCNKITFFDNVPANVKYIDLDGEGILACLISGACEFNGIPMQRCNTQYLDDRKSYDYTGEDISNTLSAMFKDRECGYSYNLDIVAQLETVIKETKAIGKSTKHHMVKDGIYFITEENLRHRQEKERQRKEKIERERIRKIEERNARMEAEKARKRAEEEKERKEMFDSASIGAAGFLATVQNMNK